MTNTVVETNMGAIPDIPFTGYEMFLFWAMSIILMIFFAYVLGVFKER